METWPVLSEREAVLEKKKNISTLSDPEQKSTPLVGVSHCGMCPRETL